MDRRYEKVTTRDLEQLAALAATEQDAFFRRNPHREYQRQRLLLAALCQGAARHYVDGRNGVKDFDIHFIYWRRAGERHMRCRRCVEQLVGAFGHRSIDLLRTSIIVPEGVEPQMTPDASLEIVRQFLRRRSTRTAWHLAKNPVIGLLPTAQLGKVVWLPDDLAQHRGGRQ